MSIRLLFLLSVITFSCQAMEAGYNDSQWVVLANGSKVRPGVLDGFITTLHSMMAAQVDDEGHGTMKGYSVLGYLYEKSVRPSAKPLFGSAPKILHEYGFLLDDASIDPQTAALAQTVISKTWEVVDPRKNK